MFEIRTKLISSEVKVDPAPSKVSYAIQRVWLRKSFRFSILVIFPILGLGILKGLFLAELLKGSKRSKSHGYEYPQPPLYHQQPQYSYGHQSYDQGYPQPHLNPHSRLL